MKSRLAASILFCCLSCSELTARVVRVGLYENPPAVFTTTDGQFAGVFYDVLLEIAREQHWELVFEYGTREAGIERLSRGDIDLLPAVTASDEKVEAFAVSSDPVIVTWSTVYTRKNAEIETFADLEGKTVAITRGDNRPAAEMRRMVEYFGINCRFIEADGEEDILLLVDSLNADAGVVSHVLGSLRAGHLDITPTPIIFNPHLMQFAAGNNEEGRDLVRAIDAELGRLKADPGSAYHSILAYYFSGASAGWPAYGMSKRMRLTLTPEESDWVRRNPVVRIGADPGFAPFEFVDSGGKLKGIARDYLNLLSIKTGLKFEFIHKPSWKEAIESVKAGEIDLLPCLAVSEERKAFLDFTVPYLQFSRVIITPLDSPVQSLQDLQGLRVAVQMHSSHDAYLREHTTLSPRLHNTFEEAVRAVSEGSADAAIGNLAVATHTIQKMALTNVKLAGFASSEPQSLSMGVRRDLPVLTAILSKALSSLTEAERSSILSKWVPLSASSRPGLMLTHAEQEWLLLHPRISVAWDPDFAPMEFTDSRGDRSGISAEYLDALEDLLGVTFDTGSADNWPDAYSGLMNHTIDMGSCMAVTPERLERLLFTDAYLTAPIVFFALEGMPYIRSIQELKERRVAVIKDYATDEWLTREHPYLNIIRCGSFHEAFDAIENGGADVLMASVLSGNYYLSRRPSHRIKIAGESPYTHKLRMAVRHDWPILRDILQKAIDALPESDRTAFYRKWVWVKYDHPFNLELLRNIIFLGILIILVITYWNRKLRREISRRERIEAALSESEQKLKDSYSELKKLEELKENLTHMIAHDLRSPLTSIITAMDLIRHTLEANQFEQPVIEYLQAAQASSEHATSLLQSLLDVARLEAHQMPISRHNLDLAECAHQAVEELKPRARVNDQRIVISGNRAFADIDPAIMKRVFINLLSNAIKASSHGALITIHITDLEDFVAAEVIDSGKGIPADHLRYIFDKYSAAARPAGRDSSVGLGLAFCKLAIEEHGGRISVESEVGKGSVFRFEIPRHPPEGTQLPER